MAEHDAVDPKLGLKVCAKRCSECLFSKARIVSKRRAEDVVAECERTNKYFLCHKSTLRGDAVVCRGFFDAGKSAICRIAERFRFVTFLDESGSPVPPQKEIPP